VYWAAQPGYKCYPAPPHNQFSRGRPRMEVVAGAPSRNRWYKEWKKNSARKFAPSLITAETN